MRKSHIIFLAILALTSSCSRQISISGHTGETPRIYPDYIDVTVPSNIAPLNFAYTGDEDAVLQIDGNVQIKASRNGNFRFSAKQWEQICRNGGASMEILVKKESGWMAHNPFRIDVSEDPIDSHIAYRLIPPGYQGWKKMGIYQRDLTSYKQSVIYENSLTNENCLNCHSFNQRDPENMVFHARAAFGGTLLKTGDILEKLDTKTDSTISALVYPFWHPDGKHIAFSVNKTLQSFFAHNPDRIEVFDSASDVVVYNIETHEISWSPLTRSKEMFETFPTFSPDGKYLYFCAAPAVEKMPEDYKDAHYNIYRCTFDASTETFGEELELCYDAVAEGKSASFPRISPDGRYLAFTKHSFGNFSIWHSDSDIFLLDLETGRMISGADMNSDSVDSYHSWSSNSRWMVFSSRRDDGLYTRPYIAHIDEDGNCSKAFMLPQKDPRRYYSDLMVSYNIPELISGEVKLNRHRAASTLRSGSGNGITPKK